MGVNDMGVNDMVADDRGPAPAVAGHRPAIIAER
jgi:hypothetical protein